MIKESNRTGVQHMEIKIRVSPEDLMNTRFAYSPLVELVTSFFVLNNPHIHAPNFHWLDEARRALHNHKFPYLMDLVGGKKHYVPDFLTPTPEGTRLDLDTEIDTLLGVSDDIIRDNIQKLITDTGETELRNLFLAYPREMMLCLVDELRLYWKQVMAHHWPSVTSILDGDILHRARQMAVNGAPAILGQIHNSLSYDAGYLTISKPHKSHCDMDFTLKGDGIQLVPTAFLCSSLWWQIVPEWRPMLIYQARGIGLWRPIDADEGETSLEIALGAGRARVLQSLMTPLNTGEIARFLDITSAAVSQHLSRLQDAGLVESHRSGKRVYYQLTRRGENLLAVFDGTYVPA
jgi:DNA-binding transcriptional ArsR family regulator